MNEQLCPGHGHIGPDVGERVTQRPAGTEVRRITQWASWVLLPTVGGIWLLLLLASDFSMLVVALGLLLGIAVLGRA
jgi:hypothetical protein